MKKNRILPACLLAVWAVLGMTGCESLTTAHREPWTPDETAVQVGADGAVTETVMDRLDQAWYNAQELTQMIQQAVSSYQAEQGETALTLESLTTEEGNVSLVLRYAGYEDFERFNNVRFFNGSILGAQMEGYHFQTDFCVVEDGVVTGTVSGEEALRHKEYQVLIVDAGHAAEVPGKVVYVSRNAHPEDAYVVRPGALQEQESETQGQPQTGLELPSSAVYTPPADAPAGSAALDESYIYVIYDD